MCSSTVHLCLLLLLGIFPPVAIGEVSDWCAIMKKEDKYGLFQGLDNSDKVTIVAAIRFATCYQPCEHFDEMPLSTVFDCHQMVLSPGVQATGECHMKKGDSDPNIWTAASNNESELECPIWESGWGAYDSKLPRSHEL